MKALFVGLMIFSSSVSAESKTQAIYLPEEERTAILNQMNVFLTSVDGIIEGLALQDFQKIADSAKLSGFQAAQNAPAIGAYVPGNFLGLARPMHAAFQQISEDAVMEDSEMVIQSLSKATASCIACHSAYHFTDEPQL